MSSVQTFTFTTCAAKQVTLQPGKYRFEVWGASGGSTAGSGGLGGYSKGELTLSESTSAFVNVGQQGGTYNADICNGGGKGDYSSYRSGGGGTDIRLISNSLYSRIIVAGGGGGAANLASEHGGYGGGLSGGIGMEDGDAGRGATQDNQVFGCVGGSTTACPKGTFGYGGNATNSGGGGGGGWFGGSAGSGAEGAGGGSGYILTSSSYKPSGYLLTNSKYYLTNAQTLGGNNAFPSPTSSGSETGHNGHGYAKITLLTPLATPTPTPKATPTATPKATMIGIEPELNFYFTSLNGDIIKDRLNIFEFTLLNNYTSKVIPGKYTFYANGSFCGQSVHVQHTVNSPSTMNISISNGVTISINGEPILNVPGFTSSFSTYINPNTVTLLNVSMSDYDCTGTGSSLKILYHPFKHKTCQRKINNYAIHFILIAAFLLTK